MEIDKEKFKRSYPHLAREMESEDNKISVAPHRSDEETGGRSPSKKFEGYNPDIIDFVRRCDTEGQAEEIIEYLEKRREITHEYAAQIRKRLKEKGVRSFGSKKEDDYYLKQAGY